MDNRKQRELKFRAWNRFKNEMFDPMPIVDFKIYEINAITLMQFTGLTDKNGKEIYEGDILKLDEIDPWDEAHTNIFAVEWGGDYPAFQLKDYGDLEYNTLQHATSVISCEIIGNTYETPDLLTPQPNP